MSKLVAIPDVKRADFKLTGGLDYSTSPEAISSECMTRADNVEYNANSILMKAEGIVPLFASGDISVAYPFNGYTLYNNDLNLYRVDLTAETPSATLIGTLEGNFLTKDSFVMRDSSLLIASGGHLQKLDTSWNLTTDSGSPHCDHVFIDNGRIMVALTTAAGGTDSDYFYWASIEDDTVWDLSPHPEYDWSALLKTDYSTTALFLEIGYRDGMEFRDIQRLANDWIVTKSDGINFRQYRFTGTFPNWQVTALEPSFSVYESCTAINDVFTIGLSGFKSLKNVIQYGDIARDETGIKVNKELVKNITQDARIWHLPLKKQIAVKIANDKVLWLYHYNQRNAQTNEIGAWTKRILSSEVQHIWEQNNKVYIATGNNLCVFDPAYSTQEGNEYIAYVAGKRFTSIFQFNLIHATIDLENRLSGIGLAKFGGFSVTLNLTTDNDIAFDDDEIAFDDEDPAAGDTYYPNDYFFECPLTREFIPEIIMNTGSAGILYVAIDYAEV